MTIADKQERYLQLVKLRKDCNLCDGLANPSDYEAGRYDSFQIGPWSQWQGNLQAELMIVGQDWGDTKYFSKWQGFDDPKNPANQNLVKLLGSLEIDINSPLNVAQTGEVFLTNAILCLKQEGGLQGPVRDEWFQNCGSKFLKPLIQIVNPKVVVALGERAFKAILKAYDIDYSWPKNYKIVVTREGQTGGIKLPGGTLLFPVYHCGRRGVNINRPMSDQLNDWKPIGQALKS